MADITVSLDTELEDPKLRVIAERGLRTFQLAVHADDVEAR